MEEAYAKDVTYWCPASSEFGEGDQGTPEEKTTLAAKTISMGTALPETMGTAMRAGRTSIRMPPKSGMALTTTATVSVTT